MICHVCKTDKIATEFNFKNKSKGLRHTQCKVCQKAYSKVHYENNKQVYMARTIRDRSKEKDKTRKLILSLKMACVKCGEDHPATLDFHHVDPTLKESAVSKLHSRKKIVEEAKKCVVLCSNCHRKVHWYPDRDSNSEARV